jgi:hypothetical protein
MRDLERRQRHCPHECSVLGWESLRGLDALSKSEDGDLWVSIPESGASNACAYRIDCQINPQIYCCAGFTHSGYWDGWEISGGPDIGPPEVKVY